MRTCTFLNKDLSSQEARTAGCSSLSKALAIKCFLSHLIKSCQNVVIFLAKFRIEKVQPRIPQLRCHRM